MGEAEVGDDYKDDSIDVHDVLLVIAITCFEIDQPKNQGKKLKQYKHDAIITCRLLCKIVLNEYVCFSYFGFNVVDTVDKLFFKIFFMSISEFYT